MEPNQLILTRVACGVSNLGGLTSGEKETWANDNAEALLQNCDRQRAS